MTLFLSHRGESDDAPENTLESFRLAVERHSDGIELDVWTSGDGQLVVAHDGNLKRLTGINLRISENKLSDLQKVYPVPLLSDVLQILPDNMQLQIEMKGGNDL